MHRPLNSVLGLVHAHAAVAAVVAVVAVAAVFAFFAMFRSAIRHPDFETMVPVLDSTGALVCFRLVDGFEGDGRPLAGGGVSRERTPMAGAHGVRKPIEEEDGGRTHGDGRRISGEKTPMAGVGGGGIGGRGFGGGGIGGRGFGGGGVGGGGICGRGGGGICGGGGGGGKPIEEDKGHAHGDSRGISGERSRIAGGGGSGSGSGSGGIGNAHGDSRGISGERSRIAGAGGSGSGGGKPAALVDDHTHGACGKPDDGCRTGGDGGVALSRLAAGGGRDSTLDWDLESLG